MKLSERLKELKLRLIQYQNAELAILNAQSYSIGSRSLTRVDLPTVLAEIRRIKSEIDRLESGRSLGAKTLRIIPRDL